MVLGILTVGKPASWRRSICRQRPPLPSNKNFWWIVACRTRFRPWWEDFIWRIFFTIWYKVTDARGEKTSKFGRTDLHSIQNGQTWFQLRCQFWTDLCYLLHRRCHFCRVSCIDVNVTWPMWHDLYTYLCTGSGTCERSTHLCVYLYSTYCGVHMYMYMMCTWMYRVDTVNN